MGGPGQHRPPGRRWTAWQGSTGAACIKQPWAPRRQTGPLLPGLDQQTGGLLQGDTGSIRTSPMELLRLYSTVYFKDGWLQEFAKEDTYPQKFRPASWQLR